MCAASLAAVSSSGEVSTSPLNQGEQEMMSMNCKKPTEVVVTPALTIAQLREISFYPISE